jgi:hypothetical protein
MSFASSIAMEIRLRDDQNQANVATVIEVVAFDTNASIRIDREDPRDVAIELQFGRDNRGRRCSDRRSGEKRECGSPRYHGRQRSGAVE